MICIEIFFLVTMCLEFLVSFENPKNRFSQVKDIERIAMRYLYGHFIHDLIPLIPLQAIPVCISDRRYESLFFLIKIIRLFTGIKFFDPH